MKHKNSKSTVLSMIRVIFIALFFAMLIVPGITEAVGTNSNANNINVGPKTNSNTNSNTGKANNGAKNNNGNNVNSTNNKPAVKNPDTVPDYKEDGSAGFVPCGNKASQPCTIHHLFRAFIVIINYLISTAGFVAIAFIVYAGFLMVTSQGESGLVDAKQRLSGAVIGLLLVAISFVLVNTLFEGSLSLGVKNGGQILTDPLNYIQTE